MKPIRAIRLFFRAISNCISTNARSFSRIRGYLYITKTTHERSRRQSNFSTLCGGICCRRKYATRTHDRPIPGCRRTGRKYSERKRSDPAGTASRAHEIHRNRRSARTAGTAIFHCRSVRSRYWKIYVSIRRKSASATVSLPAHTVRSRSAAAGSRHGFPLRTAFDRPDGLQADFAAPAGLLLGCNHIYNQYIFIDSHDEILRQFEKSARNMTSPVTVQPGQCGKPGVDRTLPKRSAYAEPYRRALSLQRAGMGRHAGRTQTDKKRSRGATDPDGMYTASQYGRRSGNLLGGIPGNAADFPAEETFYTFFQQALCFSRLKRITTTLFLLSGLNWSIA